VGRGARRARRRQSSRTVGSREGKEGQGKLDRGGVLVENHRRNKSVFGVGASGGRVEIDVINAKRVASASIRGYLYQILHAVLAWLDLKDDELLVCSGLRLGEGAGIMLSRKTT
jgi:hypothetical protein